MLFRSLRVRNYRIFFLAQLISVAGTWMQAIALDWLVLELGANGIAVGVNVALQFGPMLLLGPWGGLIADRFSKRRVLAWTQSLFLAQALVLGMLTASGSAKLWMVYMLSAVYGAIQVADNPARQAFASELVGPEDVMNAVSLNSAVFNSGRIVGPAIAGLVIVTAGIPACFLVNAATYLAILIGLALIRPSQLHGRQTTRRGRGQIREGLRYVARTPELALPLALMAVIGTFGLNFRTILPLMTRFTFHKGAHAYATVSSVMACGSLTGALIAASRKVPSRRLLVWSGIAFGATEVLAATSPSLGFAYATFPLVGLSAMLFISTANGLLQLNAAPEMRGRVLALFSLVFLGSTPIGGPLMGWLSQTWSPRIALGLAGGLCVVGAIPVGALLLRQRRRSPIEALA